MIFSRLFALILFLAALPATAQEIVPDQLMLELNRALDTDTGSCQLTVITTNRLSQGLTRAAWQIAIFDRDGIVQSLPVLDFGALVAGKTKVAVFELAGRPCAEIGQIVVNDVAECTAEDGDNLRDACLSGLATRSRADISFGI
ncbi:MAG: hypothetical protein Q4G49_05500 [Paracoccus sp. (in: a-proteobacteria)]|nr:hypothetical protein [Paracoccus sp. (in: a-proteobacteria)]